MDIKYRKINKNEPYEARVLRMMKDIPVYPKEITTWEFCNKFGLTNSTNIPLVAPICEDEHRLCFPDAETKNRYILELDKKLKGEI